MKSFTAATILLDYLNYWKMKRLLALKH